MKLNEAVQEFLSQKRIAVAGISRNSADYSNAIFRKLRDAGYDVVPVNPNAEEVEGTACYSSIAVIPGQVDGVLITAHPTVTDQVVEDCITAGVQRIWMHRSFGDGSVSEQAVARGREAGLTVIPGGCPMMYLEPDFGHRCMRWILERTGGIPKAV